MAALAKPRRRPIAPRSPRVEREALDAFLDMLEQAHAVHISRDRIAVIYPFPLFDRLAELLEHDGREPDVDDEPDDPDEHDGTHDEPSLGSPEADCRAQLDRQTCPPTRSQEQWAIGGDDNCDREVDVGDEGEDVGIGC